MPNSEAVAMTVGKAVCVKENMPHGTPAHVREIRYEKMANTAAKSGAKRMGNRLTICVRENSATFRWIKEKQSVATRERPIHAKRTTPSA